MLRLFCSVLMVFSVVACTPMEVPADAEVEASVGSSSEELTISNGIVREDVLLPSPSGVIHTEVVFRPRALLRSDRRLIVLIPGTLANGAGYFDVASGTGYNAAEILANANFIVVLPDLPGTGESYRPADGSAVSAPVNAAAVRRVALFYAALFGIHHGVDLYGETGVGTNVGLLLARENWVRTFSASATFYREFGPAVAGTLFNPPFRAGISSIPGGYAPQDPAFISLFFGAADPVIQAQAVTACVGPAPQTMPTGAFIELFALPFTVGSGPFGPVFILDEPIVDAAPAQAPALFIQGSPDFIGSEAGTAEMVAAYGATGGGEAEVLSLVGASHLMRFDVGISDGPSSPFWSAELEFLSSH